MSSYLKKLENPKTGKMQVAYCIDDFYGNHIYGYGFRRDGKDATFETGDINFRQCDFYKKDELIENLK